MDLNVILKAYVLLSQVAFLGYRYSGDQWFRTGQKGYQKFQQFQQTDVHIKLPNTMPAGRS